MENYHVPVFCEELGNQNTFKYNELVMKIQIYTFHYYFYMHYGKIKHMFVSVLFCLQLYWLINNVKKVVHVLCLWNALCQNTENK